MSEKVAVKNKAPSTEVAKTEKKENSVAKELRKLRLSPRADILEAKENFYIMLDMPGVGKDDVSVDFEEGVITVRGRAGCPDFEASSPLHRGFDVKEYYRSFQLVEGIDFGKIEATMQDGVLTITLPKSDDALPRKISVK